MTDSPNRLWRGAVRLLGSKRSSLIDDFAAIADRPAQAIPFLMLFAVGGVIFALTSRPARART